jgi:ComF family protein
VLFSRLLQQLPSLCAVCRSWGHAPVCQACSDRFAAAIPRCQRCALEVPQGVVMCGACLVDPPAFDAALAGVDYAYPWDGLVAQFKFNAALDLTQSLAERLRAAQAASSNAPPDLLLPVPLSEQRLRERGFNQAWELTQVLARDLHVPADAHLLLRVKDTPHQLALPPQKRAANVRGAFALEPLRRGAVTGKRIAVIDDVMTTGATLAEIARVLKQAGAAHVDAWVVARTPRPSRKA